MFPNAKKMAAGLRRQIKTLNRIDPNVMTFIIYGLLYDTVLNIYKPFALTFLQRLGGDEFYISLYNSLPGLVAIFALIPGSVFVARFVRKKRVTAAFLVAARSFLPALALVPLMPDRLRPLIFVVMIGLMNFPDSISQCALQAFLGENFEGLARARAISLRTKFGQTVILAVTLITGLIIRFAPKTPEQTIIYYQVFFAAAFVIGIFEVVIFSRFKEKKREDSAGAAHKPTLRETFAVFKDKKFARFLVMTIAFYFSWHLAWAAVGALQVIRLGADEIWLAVYALVSGAAAYFGASFWGKKIIKHGNDKILIVSVFGVALNSIAYMLALNLWSVIFINILGGFVSSGIGITLLNGLLEATPDKNRVIYIAAYNTLVNLSLSVSPFISLWLLTKVSYTLTFLVIGVVRVAVGSAILVNYLRAGRRIERKI